MRKAAVAAVLLAVISFSLCACLGTQSEVVSGYLKAGSFVSVYDVDETLDLSDSVLCLRFSDGTTGERKIEGSYISGFDTSTTGEKSLTVTYGEKIVLIWDYEVVYSADPTKQIKTSARLKAENTFYDAGCSTSLELRKGDLQGAAALSFTLKYSSSDATPRIVVGADWDYRIYSYGSGEWGVVVFTRDGSVKENLSFNAVTQGAETPPDIKSIIISDGEKDLDLPDAGGESDA